VPNSSPTDVKHTTATTNISHFWIMNWSTLVWYTLVIVVFFLLGRPLQKKNTKAPSFHNKLGWNLAQLFFKEINVDWQSRISDMTSHIPLHLPAAH